MKLSLKVYTNAKYAGINDKQEINIKLQHLSWRTIVTWKRKKQLIAARSNAKEKSRAMAQGICELLWLKIILEGCP